MLITFYSVIAKIHLKFTTFANIQLNKKKKATPKNRLSFLPETL